MCTRKNHTHIGAVTSYQATVILPLIHVQIKARSVAAELCWLITGSCKGFRSLSMASGPQPHSRGSCDQGHGRPDRHADEAYDYKLSAGTCSLWLIGRQCFPAEEASAGISCFSSYFSTGFITNNGIAAGMGWQEEDYYVSESLTYRSGTGLTN